VIIASKGRFDRALDARTRARRGLPSVSTMSRDEFMEATVDVWEIPPESASRVGHPAPFPVALPERLIHMNTYEGEVVLDPFMGSGTTAVAAVRTGRHFIGFDTDEGYAAAATARVAGERLSPQVRLGAGESRGTDPVDGGWATKDLAAVLLADAGFSDVVSDAKVVTGVVPTLSALDRKGRRWYFEVVGGRTTNRPGAQRVELVWRAIAKGSVVHEAEPKARFAVLTVGVPAAAAGGRALQAVTGSKKPVAGVVDLMSVHAVASLAALAR
jgi:site-specific DNA-methyltransferase (adenine-specific)